MLEKNQYFQIILLLLSAAMEQIWKGKALKDCAWFVSPFEADLRAKVPFRLKSQT